jgi:hypothetical protein
MSASSARSAAAPAASPRPSAASVPRLPRQRCRAAEAFEREPGSSVSGDAVRTRCTTRPEASARGGSRAAGGRGRTSGVLGRFPAHARRLPATDPGEAVAERSACVHPRQLQQPGRESRQNNEVRRGAIPSRQRQVPCRQPRLPGNDGLRLSVHVGWERVPRCAPRRFRSAQTTYRPIGSFLYSMSLTKCP